MQNPFAPTATAKLTSTVANQTLAIPNGAEDLLLYNGSTAVIYFRMNPTGAAAVVAVVPGGTFVDGLCCVPPSVTEIFTVPSGGGTFNYIADTTGGPLILTLGSGS